MAKKAKVKYDNDEDILYVFSPGKVRDSLQISNFIIDFDKSDKIVGIELLDASKILSKILDRKLEKKDLSAVAEEGFISVVQMRDSLMVQFIIRIKQEKQRVRVPAPGYIPKVLVSATS